MLLVGCVLVVAACGGGHPTAAPQPTPSPVPTLTLTPTPSPPATHPPRATRQPSPRPSPTRTHTTVPTVAHAIYAFPVRCSVSYGHSHHDYPATDIFAARGCPVVA